MREWGLGGSEEPSRVREREAVRSHGLLMRGRIRAAIRLGGTPLNVRHRAQTHHRRPSPHKFGRPVVHLFGMCLSYHAVDGDVSWELARLVETQLQTKAGRVGWNFLCTSTQTLSTHRDAIGTLRSHKGGPSNEQSGVDEWYAPIDRSACRLNCDAGKGRSNTLVPSDRLPRRVIKLCDIKTLWGSVWGEPGAVLMFASRLGIAENCG